jgi:hypothetical protein
MRAVFRVHPGISLEPLDSGPDEPTSNRNPTSEHRSTQGVHRALFLQQEHTHHS